MSASPADLKRIAHGPGRLELAGAPEGFDALVMADIARARGGLSVTVSPSRRRPISGDIQSSKAKPWPPPSLA